MFFLNGALFGAWASRIPAIKQTLGLDEATLGVVLLCLAGGAVVSFPLAGRWVDRIGAPAVTCFTALVYVLVMPVLGIASGVTFLAVTMVVFGAAHGAMDVAMNAWGARVEQARGDRPAILPKLHGIFSVGAGVGAGIGALFARAQVSPAAHFLFFAFGCGVFAAIVAWRSIREDDTLRAAYAFCRRTGQTAPEVARSSRASGDRKSAAWLAIPRGSLLAVALVAFSSTLGEGAMADWSAVYLALNLNASASSAALGYAFFSIAMVAVRLSGGAIIKRLGEHFTIQCSGAIALLGAISLVLAPTVWLGWLSMGLLGIGYALVMPMVFSRAAADPGLAPGAALAAVSTFAYGGMLLGPPVIGFVAHASNLRMALGVLAVFAGLMLLLSYSFAEQGRVKSGNG